MVAHEEIQETLPETGIVARDMSLEEFERLFAGQWYEYVEGVVIKIGQNIGHEAVIAFLRLLFSVYLELRPVGQVVSQFTIRLPEFPNRRREPDLMIVLNTSPNRLEETYMDGAADICIEVVSPESTERDYGEKFVEYETGKVREYWLLDRVREEAYFYRLNDAGLYKRFNPDADGNYRTPQLPGLTLPVEMLWAEQLPGPIAVVQIVQKMLQA